MRRSLILLVLVLAPLLHADDFERVLFPVWTSLFPVVGSGGSQWSASASIHNASSQPVTVFPIVSTYGRATGTMMPHTSWGMSFLRDTIFDTPDDIPGRIAYVERDRADLLGYSNQLHESSHDWTTEIPVVRERDLRQTTMTLGDVPLVPRYRLMLRVYDPFQIAGAQVLVRVWSEFARPNLGDVTNQSPTVLSETTLTLRQAKSPSTPEVEPGYAELPLSITSDPTYAVIEVIPLTPSLRFWAFVTVTDNDTQRTFTVTPH